MTENIDICFGGVLTIDGNGTQLSLLQYDDKTIKASSIGHELNRIGLGYIHGLYFRRNVIQRAMLHFDEDLQMGEDSLFVKRYVGIMDGDIHLSSSVYYYYLKANAKSLSNSYFNNLETVYTRIYNASKCLESRYDGYRGSQSAESLVSTMTIINLYSIGCTLNRRDRIEIIKKYMNNPEVLSVYKKSDNNVERILRIFFSIKAPALMDLCFTVRKQLKKAN